MKITILQHIVRGTRYTRSRIRPAEHICSIICSNNNQLPRVFEGENMTTKTVNNPVTMDEQRQTTTDQHNLDLYFLKTRNRSLWIFHPRQFALGPEILATNFTKCCSVVVGLFLWVQYILPHNLKFPHQTQACAARFQNVAINRLPENCLLGLWIFICLYYRQYPGLPVGHSSVPQRDISIDASFPDIVERRKEGPLDYHFPVQSGLNALLIYKLHSYFLWLRGS